jgi:hypothetical protein
MYWPPAPRRVGWEGIISGNCEITAAKILLIWAERKVVRCANPPTDDWGRRYLPCTDD